MKKLQSNINKIETIAQVFHYYIIHTSQKCDKYDEI